MSKDIIRKIKVEITYRIKYPDCVNPITPDVLLDILDENYSPYQIIDVKEVDLKGGFQ